MSTTNSYPVSGLTKYVGDTPKAGEVDITINWRRLINDLGAKAAFNKSHKTRALKGAVIVRFREQT